MVGISLPIREDLHKAVKMRLFDKNISMKD